VFDWAIGLGNSPFVDTGEPLGKFWELRAEPEFSETPSPNGHRPFSGSSAVLGGAFTGLKPKQKAGRIPWNHSG
jgi:hypothetical protein